MNRISVLIVDTHSIRAYCRGRTPTQLGCRQGGRYEHSQHPPPAHRGRPRPRDGPAARRVRRRRQHPPARRRRGGSTGTDPSSFTVLTANENPTLEAQITALSEDQCKAENEALPLEHQKVAQADVVQKVTLLASQDALPAHFIAGTAMVRPTGDLGTAGLVVDYKAALEKLGAVGQHPAGRGLDHRERLRQHGLAAVPVQHRGHLVQQADLRRGRHRRAADLRRAARTRTRSSPPPATRRWPRRAPRHGRSRASSACTSSATSAPTP